MSPPRHDLRLGYAVLFIADLALPWITAFRDYRAFGSVAVETWWLMALLFMMHRFERRDRHLRKVVDPYQHGWFWPHASLTVVLGLAILVAPTSDWQQRLALLGLSLGVAVIGFGLRYQQRCLHSARARKIGFGCIVVACGLLQRSWMTPGLAGLLATLALMWAGPESEGGDHAAAC